MKGNINIVLFLFYIAFIKQMNSFSLESLLELGSQDLTNKEDSYNDDEMDSDDVILKLKAFFDKYAKSVKNKIKHVDKIILPKAENVI